MLIDLPFVVLPSRILDSRVFSMLCPGF